MTERCWYYGKGNKPVGPIPESKLREMFRTGNLSIQTFVWSQPMTNWVSASTIETFRLSTTHSPSPVKSDTNKDNKRTVPISSSEMKKTLSGQDYLYTKDLAFLTKFLKTMLWISLCVSIICLLSDFMQRNLLSSGLFSQVQAESNDARQQIMCFLNLGAYVITGIAFLKWIHRANLNCHGFGAQGMKFSPGWSIGYYFIPILCLYRPYQAMKEIWRVSENPYNWQHVMASPLLGLWWALWLIAGFLGQSSFRMVMNANTISSLQASTTASIVSGIIDIPLCIVAVLLVSGVYARQEKLVRKHV